MEWGALMLLGAIRAKQTCRELDRACRFDVNEHHAAL